MTPRRILFGIALLSLLVLTTIDTAAKDQSGFRRSPQRTTERKDVINSEQPQSAANQHRVRTITVSLSDRNIPRIIKAAVKRCGCASPAATLDSWGECFGGCLERHGVSTVSAAGCVALCTRNPVGCAVCAGIQQWIVMGCAQYCVWRDVFAPDAGSEVRNRELQSNRLHAKRLNRLPQAVSPS
jgi:hypothetical protein